MAEEPDEMGDVIDLLLIMNDHLVAIRQYIAVAFWLIVGPTLVFLVLTGLGVILKAAALTDNPTT